MQKSQKGFTLVELVVVIVLLGILGVTALGRFQNLSAEAQTAANTGVASELSAASSINYAARTLGTAGAIDLSGTVDCAADLGGLFQNGYPAGYLFANTSGANTDCAAQGPGFSFSCDIDFNTAPRGTIAVATVICTP